MQFLRETRKSARQCWLIFGYTAAKPRPAGSSEYGRRENDGAQGRDRTTDTAIFSRMLYQLSYLGIPGRPNGRCERAVYREVGSACPPGFAFGYAGAGPLRATSPNIWGNTAIRRLRGRSLCRG